MPTPLPALPAGGNTLSADVHRGFVGGRGVEQPSPVSAVVVHDLVVQVLLVGQVPVRGQVLLVRLLVEVAQLGFGNTGRAWIRL